MIILKNNREQQEAQAGSAWTGRMRPVDGGKVAQQEVKDDDRVSPGVFQSPSLCCSARQTQTGIGTHPRRGAPLPRPHMTTVK